MDRHKVLAFERIRASPEPFARMVETLLSARYSRRDWIYVTRRIVESMKWLLPYSEVLEGPRFSDLHAGLTDLRLNSEQLRRSIKCVADLLYWHSDMLFGSPLLLSPLQEGLFKAGILGAEDDPELNRSRTCAYLFAIEDFVAQARDAFPKDRGGSTNLAQADFGSPKCRLVLDAIQLYSDFRRDRITGTTTGPLFAFCADFYELITGTNATDHWEGLRPFVEFVAPKVRKLRELTDEKHCIYALAARGVHSTPFDERLGRICKEETKIHSTLRRGPQNPRPRKSKPKSAAPPN